MRNLNLKFLFVLLFSAILMGCSSNKKTQTEYFTAAKAKLDEKKYDEAIAEYREYLKNYPKADSAVFAYNQIAGIQIDGLKNPQEGIKTYTQLAENFPNSKDAKQSLFMIAFIYDETLKDKQNAIKAYEAFLVKYPKDTDPNDKMSESATTMLQVLKSGKTIEEIIQENINKMGGSKSGTDTAKVSGSDGNTKVESKPLEKGPVETKKPGDKKDPASDDKE